ncbi:MAG: hypothetical protein KKG33_05750, partial [candidate division Zixibacteria bacterium]|nr:hypothetical protein [candidate division Zixibacteria bacterium]
SPWGTGTSCVRQGQCGGLVTARRSHSSKLCETVRTSCCLIIHKFRRRQLVDSNSAIAASYCNYSGKRVTVSELR